MKALVTGGAGFIGSNLVKALVADGHDVRVLDNLQSGYRENLSEIPGHMFIEGDIRDERIVREAMRSRNVVFHLAASVGNKRSIDDPIGDSEVNVIGTLRVLEAARAEGVRKVVASSSAGIYGELKHIPIREDHPIDPLTPYANSKLCMEKHCLAYGQIYGIEVACLRYFNVYGPNQRFDAYGNVIPIFVFNALDGRPIEIYGDGQQTRDFINVKDVVQANLLAARAGVPSGAYNIASGTQIEIGALAESIRALIPRDVAIVHGAERAGDVKDSLADVSMAQRAFGFAPSVAMDTGLPEYVAWATGFHQASQAKRTEAAR